jgi:hypothetical protein
MFVCVFWGLFEEENFMEALLADEEGAMIAASLPTILIHSYFH